MRFLWILKFTISLIDLTMASGAWIHVWCELALPYKDLNKNLQPMAQKLPLILNIFLEVQINQSLTES